MFDGRFRPSHTGTDWTSGGQTLEISFGKAQTFADLMDISRYRGRMAEPGVKNGQTDWQTANFLATVRPFSASWCPLVDIGGDSQPDESVQSRSELILRLSRAAARLSRTERSATKEQQQTHVTGTGGRYGFLLGGPLFR